MNTKEIIKKYSTDKHHSKNVCFISLLLFNKIKDIFLKLQNYNNPQDLNLLALGAQLHDIGIFFEKPYGLPHHKAGAKFIFETKPDDIREQDLAIICLLIRYHRKNFPSEKHKMYKNLPQQQKAKVSCFAAIIRLCDAFDTFHVNLIDEFKIKYDKNLNILTIFQNTNIMLNKSLINAVNKKKDLFEHVFQTKLVLQGWDD